MRGLETGTINPVIASEAACAREAGYGDLPLDCIDGDLRSKPVLGLETGTINPVIASEAWRSAFNTPKNFS